MRRSSEKVSTESEQMIQELAAIVDQSKDEGYDSFEYDEENEWFEGSRTQQCFKACDVTIFIYDDMISVTAAKSSVPKDKLTIWPFLPPWSTGALSMATLS